MQSLLAFGARKWFKKFVLYNNASYEMNWHHALMCDYLQKFIEGEIKRLMIFTAPQHGKSQLVSRNLPAYILGKNPDAKIILASYSDTMASGFNVDCQRIIDNDKYYELFPDTFLDGTRTKAGEYKRNTTIFETVGHHGFFKTVGVGGSLTGTPADFGIIDDPVKDALEAQSSITQQRNWDWYTDVFFTRMHNDSRILITQTRWDINDLSGKLLKQMEEGIGEQWTILKLPAIKVDESNPEDKRQIGDALWPERHNKEKLAIVRSQNIRTFESLYQQDPQPRQAGGEFWKDFSMKNVGEVKWDEEQPLHITWDENVVPYLTCLVWQMKKLADGKWHAMQIDEICLEDPRNRVKHVCSEFMKRYPLERVKGLFVYGDRTSVKEDTKKEKGENFYTDIAKYLTQYKPQLRLPSVNPSVVQSADFINASYAGATDLAITIGKNCNKSIFDYSYSLEDADGHLMIVKKKNVATGQTYEEFGHCSAAKRYFLTMAFANQFWKYLRGQAPSNAPRGGKLINRKNSY